MLHAVSGVGQRFGPVGHELVRACFFLATFFLRGRCRRSDGSIRPWTRLRRAADCNRNGQKTGGKHNAERTLSSHMVFPPKRRKSNTCYADSMDRKTLAEIAALLERIAMDRSVLEDVPADDRKRFLKAVANVYHPDRVERRRMAKVVDQQRKAARVRRDDTVLHEAGIRALRRKPVFTTPNYFLENPKPQIPNPKSQELQHCYVCKEKYTEIHHFYDQLCPS